MKTGALRTSGGSVVCARCEIADRPLARMRGLLGRNGLADGEGMLFTRTGSIHMFFMRFPIDAIFCDRELRVLRVVRGLGPWRTASQRGAKVVVELPVGAAAVEPGDRLVLDQGGEMRTRDLQSPRFNQAVPCDTGAFGNDTDSAR